MLKFYSKEILKKFTHLRQGEIKMGEVITTIPDWKSLKEATQQYVLVGIPEDIGVRANQGVAGTSDAWNAFLNVFCNMQLNEFIAIENILVLGEIDCTIEMKEAEKLQSNQNNYQKNLGNLVAQLDEKVSQVIQSIIAAGKIPIIIGGGHNNSYGNLKGASKAFGNPLNCINFDAHSDYRPLEHRHSGNGFTYAMEHGFLENYFIYGVHKAHVSEEMMHRIHSAEDHIHIAWFDDLMSVDSNELVALQETAKKFIAKRAFGLEIDLDAIASMGSSAISPIGFSVKEALQFVKKFATHENCSYMHFCEGAPNREVHPNQVGKTLAYLVLNSIRASQ